MSERTFGLDELGGALLAAVWAEKDGKLASLGLKVVDDGDFDVPAPKQMATHMNQVVLEYGQLLGAQRDKARKAYHAKHEFELVFLRLLGPTERPRTALRQGANKLASLFMQGNFGIPGYTPTNGVHVEECFPIRLVCDDGFPLGEDIHIELAVLTLHVAAICYDFPFVP